MTRRSVSALLGAAAALLISARGEPAASQEHGSATVEPSESEPGTLAELGQALSVAIVENGPDELWRLELRNDGSRPAVLIGDPGLLRLEVSAPTRTATCRLPEPLWPKTARRESRIVLKPGGVYSRTFDARFFCFADLRQTLLVPGARVVPRFGWPPETRQVRRGGKRVVETLPPTPPFVAWWAPAPSPDVSSGDVSSSDVSSSEEEESDSPAAAVESESEALVSLPADTDVVPKDGLKELLGAALVLSDAYERWSLPEPKPADSALMLRMLAGSDAQDEKEATVTLGVINTSDKARHIFARRELFEYDVKGPGGSFECRASEIGPPDVSSFQRIRAGATDSMVVRLIEMCPRGRLSHPGLYEVRARFDARWSGQGHGLDAFTGKLAAQQPALVRVRSGDRLAFMRPAALLAARAAGAAPGRPESPPNAPSDPNVDGALPLDVPQESLPEHEGLPPADEPAPMPESPSEGAVE